MIFVINGKKISLDASSSITNVLSNLTSTTITLLADAWNDERVQDVSVPEILEDANKQLIIPVPSEDSEDACKTFGIEPLNQSEGLISFYAKQIPEDDIEIVLFIFDVNNTQSTSIEEYDTDDGWHVRKWANGYVEMVYQNTITTQQWGYANSAGYYTIADGLPLPLTLAKRYSENCNVIKNSFHGSVYTSCGGSEESMSATNRWIVNRNGDRPASGTLVQFWIEIKGRLS